MTHPTNVITSDMNDPTSFTEARSLYDEVYRSSESYPCIDDVDACMSMLTSNIYIDNGMDDPFPEIDVAGMSDEDAYDIINSGARFVYLCNYKGEDCGIMLECMATNLRTYNGKYDYN